ncbi:hypothetical protein J3458_007289 [Metarhizium acridum]|uniref:uncharacterized protein n=1 Tax=Metarhizium acridum TaxID=92637 RepID=UPI001C6AF887|nr:hypothetical protein J3458_007289 [Metarhizium acridum]
MSADLFAEFSNPSTSTPPTSQSNSLFGQPPQQQQQIQNQVHIQDPFHVSSRNNAVPVHSSPSQLTSFQSAMPNSTGTWDQPSHVSQSSTVVPQQADDDDGWGDFEVAQSTEASATPQVNTQPLVSSSNCWDSYSAFKSRPHDISRKAAAAIQAPANGLIGGGFEDFGSLGGRVDQYPQSSWPVARPKTRVEMKTTHCDPNVLFDADDFELQGGGEEYDDFDEFGKFEAVESTPRSKPAPATTAQLTPSLDLLGLDDSPISQSQNATKPRVAKEGPGPAAAALSFGAMSLSKPQPLQSPANQDQPRFVERNVKKTTQTSAHKADPGSISMPSTKTEPVSKTVSLAKATANDDEWGAWDDFSGNNGDNDASQECAETHEWLWDAGDGCKATKAMIDDSSPPPTNVPPPSILLSAFPELFNTGNSLFKSVAGQSPSVKQQVLSNPKTIQFLQGYVLLASTAARVIAGRKHRWHRDKILAKSMSISAAGSKGMKLAGVDKRQSAREDREAADVVAAWREHIGRLRSAVATANSAGKANIKVPELTETPQIQTAKMVPTAPKPCIICGLKREERVAKVDVDVEDSFGEWWVDHWGHRACKNFWIEHEQILRQR